MKKTRWFIIGIVALVLITPLFIGAQQKSTSDTRLAAVAGLFYPAQKEELNVVIQNYLNQSPKESLGKIRGLICPHAGYLYSGSVAAKAYKQIQGADIKTAIMLAPSHYAAFEGAMVSTVKSFTTPIGPISVSEKVNEIAPLFPFSANPVSKVQRPDWWFQSPLKNFENENPHTWEHSLEVQLPFLQNVLPNCQIVPIVFGHANPQEASNVLSKIIDDQTVLIASSDLSHYHPYEDAQKRDRTCIQAILDLDIQAMQNQEACGELPILTLMHLAKQKGWEPKLLDYKNSGDTSGDKSRVVGYTAIAFVEKNKSFIVEAQAPISPQKNYSDDERKVMLSLARKTLESVVSKNELPAIDEKAVPQKLKETRGCFVTLTINEQLRGCIGHIVPQMPLYKAIVDNARSAAIHDFRFSKVQTSELKKIKIEISVLTLPQPLSFSSSVDLTNKLRPHIDGVVLVIGSQQATFLPQVWEQIPQTEDFLNHLSEKAGCAPSAWKTSQNVSVSTYQVEAFKETP